MIRGDLRPLEELANFGANYPEYQKGIYLYGDFGVGKSYMMAALAHDLSENARPLPPYFIFQVLGIDVGKCHRLGLVKETVDQVKKPKF